MVRQGECLKLYVRHVIWLFILDSALGSSYFVQNNILYSSQVGVIKGRKTLIQFLIAAPKKVEFGLEKNKRVRRKSCGPIIMSYNSKLMRFLIINYVASQLMLVY